MEEEENHCALKGPVRRPGMLLEHRQDGRTEHDGTEQRQFLPKRN